ncbi:MAG TPA: sigma-70 family RNA polymerase sigma factor [Planctomycetota bacterium]|nr:sigma-70 family RNA polymerase sigma factor [Planctomycetota bacterium]
MAFQQDDHERFNTAVLPHLDAAYNLARWLAKNEHDADDIVQEACVRALRFIGGFTGENTRAWFLCIVRNIFFDMRRRRGFESPADFDDITRSVPSDELGPEALLLRELDTRALREAIEELPDEFREAIVLREMEGLQYEQIAEVAGVPLGTVMSRLARARARLQQRLVPREGAHRA